MKNVYYFLIKTNFKDAQNRWLEETYACENEAQLKHYIKNYLPKGAGTRSVDLRTLRILSVREVS